MRSLLLLLLLVVVTWILSNAAFGTATLRSVERHGGGARPWNWRVLIGPWAYYPWLDRGQHRLPKRRLRRFGQWLGLIV